MQYKTLEQALQSLSKLEKDLAAYRHALGILEFDGATAAPSGSWEGRGVAMSVLSEAIYKLTTDASTGALVEFLREHQEELDSVTRRKVTLIAKNYEQFYRIPAEEYVAYTVLVNDAQTAWEKAKNAGDYSVFQPYLEKIVDYNRKFAGYYNPEMLPYDALLNEYEEGMTAEILDVFFARLRSAIVPLLEKIREKENPVYSFTDRNYPVEIQREFSQYLMEFMGIDPNFCGIQESEHPFTTNFNHRDVRITTHYYENNLLPSMYSVIHEGGHALYELGADPAYDYTALYGGVSMGIHESQSRFYENIIGRSKAFIHAIFPKVQELFPEQMADVDADGFWHAVNRVEPSLIRIESDELCYCLHIMVRYEIEKQLIAGTLAVADVPAMWNRLYSEYLGVEVPNDALGCLQDIHWSCGNIGYFPSYALGSAYGAQMSHKIIEELGDVYAEVEKGDLSHITGWLRENIHRHASYKTPGQVLEDTCGKFNPEYYIAYLTEKYTTLYNL